MPYSRNNFLSKILTLQVLIFCVSTFVCIIIGFLIITSTPLLFKGTILLAPPLTKNTQSSASSLGASLIGLTAQAPPTFSRFQDLMVSSRVAQKLIDRHHLDLIVFADSWNAAKGEWHHEDGFADYVRALFGLPKWVPPDAVSLAEFIQKSVKVTKSATSNAIELTFYSKDSKSARDVLSWLYAETEEQMVIDARLYYEKSIPYLEDRLKNVTNVDEKKALSQLLLDAEEQLMLVNYQGVYAAEVVDGPSTPARPSKAYAMVILALSLIAGPALTVLWILARRFRASTAARADFQRANTAGAV